MTPKTLKACAAADVPPGAPKSVSVDGLELAVLQADGRFYAIENACPHRGGPLSDGPVKGTTVTCPWHGWDFDAATGACLNNPAVKARTFPVEVQGSDLIVTL